MHLLQHAAKGIDMALNTLKTLLVNSSRRDFIIKGTLVGGGLMLGLGVLPEEAFVQAGASYDPNTPTRFGDAEVNAWVSIKPDDTVFIRVARSEMGQGARTGLAQFITEELECDWRKVKTQSATPGQSLARKRV
jgi:isoquinoline 1-oxidoreductase beta subunit